MPKDGDVVESWCKNCEKETTHVYQIRFLETGWKCLGCGRIK